MQLRDQALNPRPVCDLVDIADSDWQPVIEAYLGPHLEALLISEDEEKEAFKIYRGLSGRQAIYGVKIVTDSRQDSGRTIESNSVASLIEGDHPAAVAYLRRQLGDLQRATTDSEALSGRRTLTQDGMLMSGGVTLRDLVDFVAGTSLPSLAPEDGRVGEALPFPYLAIVGQHEMKLALLLGLINPNIGGILLIGPRGTAKTTAVRSLLNILPMVDRSTCPYGCLPEDIEVGGIEAVCPDCARKYGEGQPLTAPDKVRLIELPSNARLDDVVGGIDERAAVHERMRIRRGILAQADHNLLYIDEINQIGRAHV